MLGTDPCQPIPSAVELLRHPWFPIDGVEDEGAIVPMPLKPGQKVGRQTACATGSVRDISYDTFVSFSASET